jgi:NAD(P)-dependent dehydrogenase (short-subunit alcohol dehydrogenase family)
MHIDGVSAIVTGGGSGLGQATAVALSEAGCRVAVLDRNAEAAAAVASSIGGIACPCDVTETASIETALAAARTAQGPARIVINCAGIGTAARVLGRDGPVSMDAFERVVRVNLFGTFNILRLAAADLATLAPLADGERGVIINTASVAAFDGQIGQAAYAASKGAVVAMTLPIARELARIGVRVVTIAPGLFRTPLMETLPIETQQGLASSIPFPQRLGHPTEFADLVVHIARNSFLNGETIRLDGALRMAPK